MTSWKTALPSRKCAGPCSLAPCPSLFHVWVSPGTWPMLVLILPYHVTNYKATELKTLSLAGRLNLIGLFLLLWKGPNYRNGAKLILLVHTSATLLWFCAEAFTSNHRMSMNWAPKCICGIWGLSHLKVSGVSFLARLPISLQIALLLSAYAVQWVHVRTDIPYSIWHTF